jgi:tRNA U34 5-methylaminomethyl-2-thiouridine-forming methyltransferase MnmC
MGLMALKKESISILEIGFGTGLNTLLTLLNSEELKHINYQGIELYPLDKRLLGELNFEKYLSLTEEQSSLFNKMHNSLWEKSILIDDRFTLKKIRADFTNYFLTSTFDLVYFDAFAPQIQPELWTEKLFLKLFRAMNQNGILVTYCAKGKVRRSLQKAGFKVNRLPGPPGKREMIQAIKE